MSSNLVAYAGLRGRLKMGAVVVEERLDVGGENCRWGLLQLELHHSSIFNVSISRSNGTLALVPARNKVSWQRRSFANGVPCNAQ